MGNIGSEFFRMISLKEKGDLKNSKESFVRVLELIDLTIEDKKEKGGLFEILRVREIICDLFLEAGAHKISLQPLKKYFIDFVL